jgi:predicted PhzF superfamily epimerase YddE/YHI9
MKLRYHQIDAFTHRLFAGNPAGVVLLDHWLPDALMQSIAAQHAHSDTAFCVAARPYWQLRWFTPVREATLCGHATLAAAHVVFHHVEKTAQSITFSTCSGLLHVRRRFDSLLMDFPSDPPLPAPIPPELEPALGARVFEYWVGARNLALVESEAILRALRPVLDATMSWLDGRNLIVTAPGTDYDFVSRYFAPFSGVPEDPVTGSAHCTLTPFWAARQGKRELSAWQASARGGAVLCELQQQRVLLTGQCVEYLSGEIDLSALRH